MPSRGYKRYVLGSAAIAGVALALAPSLGPAKAPEGFPDGTMNPKGSKHPNDYPLGSLASRLAVFGEQETTRDAIPPALADTLELHAYASEKGPFGAGTIFAERVRLVAVKRESGIACVYAMPTSMGWVCYALVSYSGPDADPSLDCIKELDGAWSYSSVSAGIGGTWIYGLMADDVVQLTLSSAQASHRFSPTRNGFVIHLKSFEATRQWRAQLATRDGGVLHAEVATDTVQATILPEG